MIIPIIFPVCEKNARRGCQVFIMIIGSTLRSLAVASRIKVKRRSHDFVGKTFLVWALQWKCTRMEFRWSTYARALSQSPVFFFGTDLFTRRSLEISCAERLLRNSIPIEVYGFRGTCNDICDSMRLKREDIVETDTRALHRYFSMIYRFESIDQEC